MSQEGGQRRKFRDKYYACRFDCMIGDIRAYSRQIQWRRRGEIFMKMRMPLGCGLLMTRREEEGLSMRPGARSSEVGGLHATKYGA